MDTPNLILMAVLCVMIGFAIGNIWGREKMKKTFSDLINSLGDSLSKAAASKKKEE